MRMKVDVTRIIYLIFISLVILSVFSYDFFSGCGVSPGEYVLFQYFILFIVFMISYFAHIPFNKGLVVGRSIGSWDFMRKVAYFKLQPSLSFSTDENPFPEKNSISAKERASLFLREEDFWLLYGALFLFSFVLLPWIFIERILSGDGLYPFTFVSVFMAYFQLKILADISVLLCIIYEG